ncbi:MAG: hypothetical protein KAW86_04795, partial [Bacteroidales bacterium]|nr:hypothetical protein [Bacteroidales bacterium]
QNDIKISITDKAIKHITEMGYDPQFGARPIKRIMQRNILNELSKMILAGKVIKDSEINIDFKDNKLVFENK